MADFFEKITESAIIAINHFWINTKLLKEEAKMRKLTFLMLCVGFMCSGCFYNNDATLKRESARVIGELTPDEIKLYDIDRGAMQVDWKVKTPKGNFNCSADDMMRRAFCVKKNGKKATKRPKSENSDR